MKTKTEQLKIRPQRELYVDGALIKTRAAAINADEKAGKEVFKITS